ncbi:MAG: LysE family transporter [Verrucomicrobia bacterium]|nr:LysE family transporter [Verrucomicrobiota bacterium]
MLWIFLLKGIAVGFCIAAPVGPIGALCIRRSLTEGRLVGFVTGLGAATADAAYGGVAGFGLRAVSGFLIRETFWFELVGGVVLCGLGVRIFRSPAVEPAAGARAAGLRAAYWSTLLLTLTNPTTILSFIALFAGFGLSAIPHSLAAGLLVAGVFLGSALWSLLLSSGVGWFRARASSTWLRAVNRFSGGVILVSGIYALLLCLRKG